ncbi:CARDB domain-containing protein [Hyalangium gracile]|uniref:CARDB domain-containing protein n=1 Tax=Hyalangium gracile TaxID=394092 RepID=UPI001CD03F1B|nr:CARDB domain-containing protein [Hyalangium gracile]
MKRCHREALLGAVLLSAVGCGAPEEAKQGQGGPKVTLQQLATDPDFVVTKVSAPTSATPGSTFQTTVEVCNRGGSGSGVDVNLYFSDDGAISPSDFWVESLYVAYLSPGQCQRESLWISASVPMDGPWYLGAYADPYGSQLEDNEDNNGLASPVMGIGYGADFVITSVTGPDSATIGAPMTVQVTVCNRGTEPDSTDVELYLSEDEFIYPNTSPGPYEDSYVGDAQVDYLFPGQCRTVPVFGPANLPNYPMVEGAYYLGAVVDPDGNQQELIEDNNALAGYRMGVGHGPDFVIQSVTGPSGADEGQPISTKVTVCNRGTQPDSTEVAVYLSVDDSINPGDPPGPAEDLFVGMASTDTLHPGQCRAVSVNGPAHAPEPGFEGPYYVGAVADPNGNQEELIEDNNALAGYRIGLGHGPDFVVTSVTGPASAGFGAPITARVTVCNRGTQPGSTEVEALLSADDVIRAHVSQGPAEDYPLGSAHTDVLPPGQCATLSVNGGAYAPPPFTWGPYFLGAVTDPYGSQEELIEDNNALAGYRIGLGDEPDFVVTSVTGPASAPHSHHFVAQVTVCNRGTRQGSTEVETYVSADDVIRSHAPPAYPEDYPMGSAYVDSLYPGQCRTVPVEGGAYVPPPGNSGPYYVGAVVDPRDEDEELIEDNNANAGYRMGVGYGPDFVVTSVTGPASAQFGQSITAQVTVCNRGTEPGSTEVEAYLSEDETIRANLPPYYYSEDYLLGWTYVDFLHPGQCRTVPVEGNAYPAPPGFEGAYYLGAVVDAQGTEQELIEDNNALAGYRMGLGHEPDFVVTSVTGPASAESGASFIAQATVCNRGTRAMSTEVEVYLSFDEVIRPYVFPNPPEDAYVGVGSTNILAPGQCATVPVPATANTPPPGGPGPYYLGAVVDPYGNQEELIEDNNALTGYRMGVGHGPDFVIQSVTGPASATPGQLITAQVTVCNQGTALESSDVEVYLSADDVIRTQLSPGPGQSEESYLGSAPTGGLYPGQCATVAVSGNAQIPSPGLPGAFYVGALVDPYGFEQELNEDNNALAGYRMGLGNDADFIVTSVTGPFSAEYGEQFTPQVTVCNQGTRPDIASVEVYFSVDQVIRPYRPEDNPPEDGFVGSVSTGELYPGQCATVSVEGYAQPPPPEVEGPYYVGVIVDPYNHRPELNEDNNVHVGYRMGVGHQTDFVVTSVTGPFSAQNGQSITPQVTVCNRGTQIGLTDVEVYLSADEIIRPQGPESPPEDSLVGVAVTEELYPGQCVTVPVSGSVNAPSPGGEGAYYVGAIADPYGQRPELIEDNNALAGYRMGVGTQADFVITSVTGPYSARPGTPFTASVGICNRGQQSGTTDVELYLSADANVRVSTPPIPPEDFFLGVVPSVSLAAGGCTTRSLSVTAPPVPEGAYYLGGVADPYGNRPELIEDNNAKAGSVIGVGTRADFVVTTVAGPSSAKPGMAFTANVTVCNRGQQQDTADVDVYLSADTTVRVVAPPAPPEDHYLGTVTGVSLAAGACATRPLSVTAPEIEEGAYYLSAVADPYGNRPELIEDNNAKAGSVIGVGNKADFVITAVTGPSSVRPGATFTASVTVCNRGRLADVTDVALFFSTDADIRVPTSPAPHEDILLGSLAGVSLGVGACSTRSIVVNGNVPSPGTYYLGAVADASNTRVELIEDNNAKAGTQMSVAP